MNAGPDTEDAYEAAMRAADALFARPAAPRAVARSTDGWPESQPASFAGAHEADHAAPERGGRILPVIDEAPLPQFAALEAEHAPKRRGRKPGSKNKPKVETVNAGAIGIAKLEAFEARTNEANASDEHWSSGFRDTVGHEGGEDGDTVVAGAAQAPGLQTLEAIPAAETAPRGQRRVVRGRGDRVKPGEGWKRRRLPRVCW